MTKSGSDSGIKNEKDIAIFFGNGDPIKYSDIPESNLKKFVLFICKNKNIEIRDDLEIIAVTDTKLRNEIKWSGPGNPKIDMNLKIDGKSNYISFKSGKSNSTEEEKVSDFIKDLKIKTNLDIQNEKEIKKFIYFKGHNFKYKSTTKEINRKNLIIFFDKNKKEIIKKAIIINDEKTCIEFFYVTQNNGDYGNGIYANSNELIKFLTSFNGSVNDRAAYPVGRLRFKAKQRKVHPGKIQFQWANPYRDIKIVRNND